MKEDLREIARQLREIIVQLQFIAAKGEDRRRLPIPKQNLPFSRLRRGHIAAVDFQDCL